MLRGFYINNDFRLEYDLTLAEYAICELINIYSGFVESKVPGWCYMNRENMAKSIGISRRLVISIILKMAEQKFLEIHPITKHVRPTGKWQQLYPPKQSANSAQAMQSMSKNYANSALEPSANSAHNNIDNTDNNKDSSNTGATAPVHVPEEKGNKKNTVFVAPELPEVENYFIFQKGNTKLQHPWPEDRCKTEAFRFHNHYESNGWVQNGGKKIKDWKAAARNFMLNASQGIFSASFTPRNDNKPSPAQMPPVASPAAFVDKISKEVQYLYARYCEDEKHVTIISIDVTHYDWLYKHGMFARLLSPHEVALITEKAIAFNPLAATNEELKKKFCKCYAVLSAFEKFKQQGKENLI